MGNKSRMSELVGPSFSPATDWKPNWSE